MLDVNDSIGLRTGLITAEALRLANAAWAATFGYVAALVAIGMVSDQWADVAGANFAFSLVSTIAGYALTIALLRQGGLAQTTAGFGTYFGLSILMALGIGLGVVALVIPGLVLFVRWAPAYGFAMGEGVGIIEAMRLAWERTSGHFIPLAIALLLPVTANLVGITIYTIASDEAGVLPLPVSALTNLVMSLAGAAITAVTVAAYGLLGKRETMIEEVFG
jgi:hypothetical protein